MSKSTKSEVLAFSLKGASEASSLSIRTIRDAIAAGKLKSRTKGRRRIILARDLERYLREK